MKSKLLMPNQIITLQDYPLHNEHVLKIYFRVFLKNQGRILPPCPVIHKSSGIPIIKGNDTRTKEYNAFLNDFLARNPRAEYFLLDGSHKTTAATLSKKKIPVLILEKDEDFIEAKSKIKNGEYFGWHSTENSVKDAMDVLAKHHFGKKKFMTVQDKTNLLVQNKDVPDYMMSYYTKKR